MTELQDLLAIAEAAAVRASMALLANRADWSVIEAEHGREVKIDADKHAEALILAAISALGAVSDHLRGERLGARQGAATLVWAVDPLDGSVNYLAAIRTAPCRSRFWTTASRCSVSSIAS